MKKLIVLSVVFALVAGAAFAADVSAEVIGMTNILSGDSSEGTDGKVSAGGWPGGTRRVSLVAAGEDESGVFGGWLRLQTYGYHDTDDGIRTTGYAWWKPIEQLQIQLGMNPDGFYSRDGFTRWGFYQVAGDTNVVVENWQYGAAFYEGWNVNGLMVTATPIENLFVLLGIPFSAGGEAKDVFEKMHIQVAYDISNIGQVALTYASGHGHRDALGSDPEVNDPGKFFLFFDLKAVENLGVNFGVGYSVPLKWSDKLDFGGTTYTTTYTRNEAVAIGLGLSYNADAFGIKARVQGQFGQNYKTESDVPGSSTIEQKGGTVVDFDILPSYAINDKATILLSAGLQINKPNKGDAVVLWHVEPYVTIKSNWWAPNFYFGFRFERVNDDTTTPINGGDPYTTWSIPMGIVFAF